MTRRDKQEHWEDQTHMAMLGTGVTAFAIALLGLAAIGLPALGGTILRACLVLLLMEAGLGTRVIYSVYRHRQLRRRVGK